jgi:multidrug efflux system membrane fusion protein
MLYNIFKFLKSKRGIYSIALFLSLIITIFALRHKAQVEALPQQEIIVSAKTITPEEKTIFLSAYGTTIANSEITIKANLAGKLTKKHYQKGDFVNVGADLFSLASLEYSSIIEKAQLNLAHLEESYAKLKQNPKALPNELKISEKAVENARQQLKNASSYTNINILRAPFTGKINDILVEEGDSVKAGDPVAKIIQISPSKVLINLPEKFINDIKLNDQIYLEILNKQNLTATISYISSSIDDVTKTFAIEAIIKDETFPIGATVTASLPLSKALSYKITRSALTIDSNSNIGILHIDKDNKAQFLAAIIIEDNQDNLWIKCDSQAPLRVITNGSGFVTPGTTVTAQEEND